MKLIFLRRQGLGLESIRNVKRAMQTKSDIYRIDLPNRVPVHDMAINWGNVRLNNTFNKIVNKPDAISEISNKGKFRLKLYEAGLSMFTTNTLGNVNVAVGSEHKKLLIRPANHMGGRDIHIVNDVSEIEPAIRACGYGWYASEYIPKVKEFRVFVANGRAVYVVEKIVPDTSAVAWNVAQGGRFENVRFDNWNLRAVKTAIEAFLLTSLDFGAVDVIVDNNNKPYVLEINSAPSLTAEYWSTCVAKAFEYMVNNGLDRIPLPSERGGYKKFIHPCMVANAVTPVATRIERREVQRTRNVQKSVSWSLSSPNIILHDNFEALRNEIAEQIRGGSESGEVILNLTETYTDYEDVEVNI